MSSVVDLTGRVDIPVLAAVIADLDLLLTVDTGPMHLASATGTPIVAIFGPSDPARYGPTGPRDRIVRVDLPCSPCNRIRQPPARCVGHTPDCLMPRRVPEIAKIRELVGYRPTVELDEILRRVIEYFRQS